MFDADDPLFACIVRFVLKGERADTAGEELDRKSVV